MLINTYSFQNPYAAKNQTGFKAKTKTIQELQEEVVKYEGLKEEYPYNSDLPAILKRVKNELQAALKAQGK